MRPNGQIVNICWLLFMQFFKAHGQNGQCHNETWYKLTLMIELNGIIFEMDDLNLNLVGKKEKKKNE